MDKQEVIYATNNAIDEAVNAAREADVAVVMRRKPSVWHTS